MTNCGWSAHLGDEVDHAFALLGLADLDSRRCFDAAYIDDLGTLGDHLGDPGVRLVFRPGRALVIERVGGAVDDGHHQRLCVIKTVAP